MKKVIVEICLQETRTTSIKKALENGFFTVWTPERIKGAFAGGHGTVKDFERYKKDNKNNCIIREYTPDELAKITPYYTI